MKKRNRILIIASIIFIAFLSLGTVLAKDISFSEDENRYLQKKPELSIKNILDGSFEEKSEKYLNDQIIGRKTWVKVKNKLEYAAGIRDINGVYICNDKSLVEKIGPEDFSLPRYKKNLKQVEGLIEECKGYDIDVRLMLVPTAAHIKKDKLPQNAVCFDEEEAVRLAKKALGEAYIDVYAKLKEAPNDVYYLTDHHWNYEGARLGYEAFCGANKKTPRNHEKVKVTEDFKGTLYSKALLSEDIRDEIFIPENNIEYTVSIDKENFDSIYFMDRLDKKDKYEVFFGGNYDYIEIEKTGNKDRSGKSILIIKDSYANSFVPFILDDFDKITMVDSRFYRANITELAKGYDQVLVLYGINRFAEERLSFNQELLN